MIVYVKRSKDPKANNAYMREYMLKRIAERKKKAKAFLGGKCVVCESEEDLEFDHIDPKTKKYTIAAIWTYSEKIFWSEIRKCQLLCNKHHKKKHDKHGKLPNNRIPVVIDGKKYPSISHAAKSLGIGCKRAKKLSQGQR